MEPELLQRHEAIVIGAGASGMAAAVVLAEAGADVALLEANDMPGRKLLATGNGKCNFTNSFQSPECYRGGHPEAAMRLLERFDVPYILGFFERIGILARQREGYWYPNSEQAASVREAFVLRLWELGVPVYENTHADAVCTADEKKEGGKSVGRAGHFRITASHRRRLETGKKNGKKPGKPVLSEPYEIRFEAEYLVLATGGCAGNISGADGSGYTLAAGFGHRIVPPVPALVQLRAKKESLAALSGVRVQAEVLLRITSLGGAGENGSGAESVREYRERGEILFADYGLSGIPAMQLSRFAARELAKGAECGKIEIFLDFFPDVAEKDLKQMLAGRFAAFPKRTAEQALTGLLPSKLTAVLLQEAGLLHSGAVEQGQSFAPHLCRLAHKIKNFHLEIYGTNDFASAQTTAGGVDLAELDIPTMESGRWEKLYIVGELADIDGTCGGYNLHWAWMSGLAAAEGILEKRERGGTHWSE